MYELVWDEPGTFVKKKACSEKTHPVLCTLCDEKRKAGSEGAHKKNDHIVTYHPSSCDNSDFVHVARPCSSTRGSDGPVCQPRLPSRCTLRGSTPSTSCKLEAGRTVYLFDQLAGLLQLAGVERLPRAKNEIWYLGSSILEPYPCRDRFSAIHC